MDMKYIKSSFTYSMVSLIEAGHKFFDKLPKEEKMDLIYKYLSAIDWDDDISVGVRDFVTKDICSVLLEEYGHRVGEWYDDAAEQVGMADCQKRYNIEKSHEEIVNDSIPLYEIEGRLLQIERARY